MVRRFTPYISLAVVMALALAAVIGAMSLANPAMAAPEAPADSRLTERVDSPQTAPTVSVTATSGGASLGWAANADANAYLVSVRTNTGNASLDGYQHFEAIAAPLGAPTPATLGGIGVTLGADVNGGGVPTVTGATIAGLSNDTEYCFVVRVRITNATGPVSGYSTEVCATPKAAPEGTATPRTGDDASEGGAGQVTLRWTWQQTSGTPAATNWQYRRTATGTWTDLEDVTSVGNNREATISGLDPGTSVIFHVRPVSADGVAGGANTVSADISVNITQGPEFMAGSNKPGAATRYDITFQTSVGAAGRNMNTATDELVITLEDFGLPGSISPDAVAVSGNLGGTTPRETNPQDVSVSGDKITIIIGDLLKDNDATETTIFANDATQDTVTVVFFKRAGITNPKKAGKYSPEMKIDDANATPHILEVTATDAVTIERIVELSETDGGLGDTVTATASGFASNVTVRFFVDGYDAAPAREVNGMLNQGEDVLCAATSSGDNVASCEFMVSTPVFKSGKNYVNAVDGLGNVGSSN